MNQLILFLSGLITTGTLFLAATAWGWPAGRRLFGENATGAAFGTFLGLVGLSRTALLLAEIGLASRFTLGAAAAVVLVCGFPGVRRAIGHLSLAMPRGWALVPVAGFLVLVLYPVCASPVIFWDSRVYHLALPEIWIETGSIMRNDKFEYSFYPNMGEGLQAFAFLSPYADPAHIVIATFPLMLFPILFGGGAALWCVAAGTPGVMVLGLLGKTTPFFGLASAASILPFLRNKISAEKMAIASGAGFGAALGSHYGALYLTPFLAYFWIRHFSPRLILTALTVAGAIAAPQYLTNFFATGDVLFPFMTKIPAVRGMRFSASDLAGFADPMQFETLGVGSTLGFVLPIGAVAALLSKKKDRLVILLACLTLAMAIALQRHPRYALGTILLLMYFAANGWESLSVKWCAVISTIGVLELFFLIFFFAGAGAPLAVAAGIADPAQYLRARVTDFPLASWAGERLPPQSVASLGVLRQYGWKGTLEPVVETEQPAIIRALRLSTDSMTVVESLRREGFTHLAVNFPEWHRLIAQYGHAKISDTQLATLETIIASSTPIAEHAGAILIELPR